MTSIAPLQVFDHVRDISPDEVMGGHVNFAQFFRYVGHAFHEWYEAMEIGLTRDQSQGGPVMATVSMDLLGELFYPGRVRVRLTVTRLGRSSLEHQLELFDESSGQLCAKGRSVNVWRDPRVGGSAPWPPEITARCWAGPRPA